MEIDPVCGMEVDPASAKFQTRYKDKDYYFCAKGCLETFEKDPNSFLEKKTAEHPVNSSSSVPFPSKLQQPQQEGSGLSFQIKGMSCASCVARIEDSLKKVDGIYTANVNLATNSGTINYDAQKVDFPKIQEAVEKAGGYEVELQKPEQDHFEVQKVEYLEIRKKFWLAAVLTIPIFVANMFLMWFPHNLIPYIHVLLLVLTTPVLFWCGRQFFVGFWRGLKHFNADMNTLIVIGTSAAYFYSAAAILSPQWLNQAGKMPEVYFDTTAVIVTLILLGRMLESRAKGKTTEAIRQLMSLRPKTAILLENGQQKEIRIVDLKTDDIVLIRQGDQIPSDGIIVKGSSAIDESMISGESIPITKKENETVIGGTINTSQPLHVQITKVGDQTMLAQIIRLVEEAQSSKAPIQHLVDRVAGIFVPIVIVIAILTFALWYFLGPQPAFSFALLNFIGVLIVACPCALGLATPTAIIVGTGEGARHGILIKNGESLEIAHEIDTVAFDKTGTITEGKPQVSAILAVGDERTMVRISASLERKMNHPLAAAIVEYAKTQKISTEEVQGVENHGGRGITSTLHGRAYALGSLNWLSEKTTFPEAWTSQIEEERRRGATLIGLVENGAYLGLFAFQDKIRDDSALAIQELKNHRINTVMITGDNRTTAESVAKKVGVPVVYSDVKPDGKAGVVADLQRKGHNVAMVGDGINDAPALAKADLGIAIGTGTDIAIQTSDITLVRGSLMDVFHAIELSRKTMKTIRQNLFWAFIYNILAIPVAAGVLYPFFKITLNPMIASLAMAFSSVFVVTNSLLLKRRW